MGKLKSGDRLLIYVTSHGGPAKGDNAFNTSISCWDKRPLSVPQFEEMLSDAPDGVSTIMIMAQCYCGGFAHAIFEDADFEQGLASGVRVGFFAQQHDLAAAGCRPDIENDDEFSSYFWGALVGRTRNGETISTADCNNDGRVSFAEAHAFAVIASETIDIPLSTSEVILRAYSAIGDYDDRRLSNEKLPSLDYEAEGVELASLTGNIDELCVSVSPEIAHTVKSLCTLLEINFEGDVSSVFELQNELQRSARSSRSRGRGRRGRSSVRRQLREEIVEKWPDLEDRDQWRESELLEEDKQSQLFEEFLLLPSYEQFQREAKQREESSDRAKQNELLRVKCKRLVNALERVVLEENLPRIADPEVIERFREVTELENTFL